MNNQIELPRYVRIALDVAHRICNDEFKENDKIRGRSTLAGEYNVSPETIRRSAALLSDMDVVEVTQKSGIYIKSKQNAYSFIQKFSTKKSISLLKANLKALTDQKIQLDKEIQENITSIIEYSTNFRNSDIIHPLEIEVPLDSHIVGKTISELQFWHNTGATIVGVCRGETLLISPGPYFAFDPKDIIVFVGSEDVLGRVMRFVRNSD